MTIYSFAELSATAADRRDNKTHQAIKQHLGDMMLAAPYKPGYQELETLDHERMAYEGGRQPAAWLDVPPLFAEIDLFRAVSRHSCFRVRHIEHSSTTNKSGMEVVRQGFDIDFNNLPGVQADIHHFPDPDLLASEPKPVLLVGEDAWNELQRVIGMRAVDA